ncbi:MAG: hypothetical protein GQ551_14005 [Myxococcales bacterium]|nr:hypothetical protein [Myxococcales bacterium]
MSQNRRNQHRKWLPWVALLALVVAGCNDSDSAGSGLGPDAVAGTGGSAGTGEGAGGQGGAGAPSFGADADFESNPVDLLLANPQRNPGDVLGGIGAPGAGGYGATAAACYASADACGDAECRAFASCCVNTGACCEPILDAPPLPAVIDFQKCAGQTADGCAEGAGSGAISFGELDSVLSPRGFIPNGTATAEGGALIGDAVDLSSQRVEVEVQFTLPVGCNGTCLESAGIAFTSSAPDAFVDAGVGLLLSGSREVVNLMLGNAVADSFDAGTDDTRWRLVLSPDGSAQVLRDSVALGTYSFDAAALQQARFVVFGRNLGAADTSAAIAVIEVSSSLCDTPASWNERQAVTITLGGNEVPEHAFGSAPSIVDLGARRLMAYKVDGEIFLAEQEAPGELFLGDGEPTLVPTEAYDASGVEDPELVWDGSSMFLFYTARDANGVGSIAAAVSDQSLQAFVKGQRPSLVPTGDVLSYDAPSALYRDGLWLLVVRATLVDGTTEFHAFYSDLGADWSRVIDGGLEKLTHSDNPTSEVTDPSLIIHNSAYQLYYARRTGTRWSVELAVSDELLVWRSIGDVLGDSDEDFDSLGARSPDALSQPDRIDIVYSGQDGVSFRLGAASRAAPSETAPGFF